MKTAEEFLKEKEELIKIDRQKINKDTIIVVWKEKIYKCD